MPKKKTSPFAKDVFARHQLPEPEQLPVQRPDVDLEDVEDMLPDTSYRSYLPAKPLTYQPANCVEIHPTNPRYCKVAVPRFMHQVEKRRKVNKLNVSLQIDNEPYVQWQFMPRHLIEQKIKENDKFFLED